MSSVSAEIELLVPPSRVWKALTNFNEYQRWHPYYLVEDTSESRGQVEVVLRARPNLRASASFATGQDERLLTLEIGHEAYFALKKSTHCKKRQKALALFTS